jgi:hypothetical protein
MQFLEFMRFLDFMQFLEFMQFFTGKKVKNPNLYEKMNRIIY